MEGAGNRKFSILSSLEEEQKVEIGAPTNPVESDPKNEETKLADTSPKIPIKIIGKIYYHY